MIRIGRAAFAFVFVTVLLDMLALGVILPVLPRLIVHLEGGDIATAAATYGLFATAFALMQFVASPVLGALSDRFGRRPVILLSNLGLALDYVIMALAPSVALLFVGRLVSGGTSATYGTASAYIADVTAPERRAARFGLLGVAFGIGFILGPAVGGLLGAIDLRAPFWAAAALSLANFAYGAIILPESLPPERRGPFRPRAANPIGAFAFLRAHPGLLTLGGAAFLAYVAHDALPTTFVLYAQSRFGFDEPAVGGALAVAGVSSLVVQGLFVGRVVRALGERAALVTGLVIGLSGQLVLGLAPIAPVFLLGLPLWSLFGLVTPSLQGLATRLVDPSAQGRLQGSLSSLHAVGTLIAPLLFSQVFALAVGPLATLALPGAPFVLAAGLLGAAATIVLGSVRLRADAPVLVR